MARNLSFLKSKKLWAVAILVIVGLFVLFFFQGKEPLLVSQFPFPGEITDGVASFLYRYDVKEKTYVPENSEGWKNKDFVRYVFDVEQDLTITNCIYFIYDAKRGETRVLKTRECNKSIAVSVGQERACSSQGEGACLLYVYATASDGTTGQVDIGNYSIDYEAPVVSKIFVTTDDQKYPIRVSPGKELTFMATASDNEAIAGCWLYANGNAVGPMELSCEDNAICRAQKSYILPIEQELHNLFVQCADHYEPDIAGYLNTATGASAVATIIKNHPPDIVSCRVTPPQGTADTQFLFAVEAIDPDEEKLHYQWEFGDGITSEQQKPQHVFLGGGTYSPRVTVTDNAGEKQECFTAWVVIK